MNKAEIFNQLQSIMVELFELDAEQVTLQSHLYEDLDLDSIDAVDLVVQLQNITGEKIKPEEFKQVRTVADIVTAVDELINA
ncbi:Acyl carrier protein [Sinobacterium norvegicum]|uniref:Acyl carrier protein n=1 Tax=Sinobacterium norvegicum TaxID=1641715 RepID=A0ABM9AE95_9GAMM|nr:acyl carrier protein [Sinobacterium norvegicum]CAH0991520.1 Acyl carrier protein [Sinobacterium norvegicum]